MSREFDSSQKTDSYKECKVAPIDQSEKRIKDYYKSLEIGSDQFYAVVDYTCEKASQCLYEESSGDKEEEEKLNSIRCVIKNRMENGRYKVEFEQIKVLLEDLTNALSAEGAPEYSKLNYPITFLFKEIICDKYLKWKKTEQKY